MGGKECHMYHPKTKFGKCLCANFYRYCMSGFIQNFSTYFYWILVPLIGNDMNTSSTALGLLQSVSSIVYALMTIPAGSWISEAMRPGIPMRVAIVVFLIGGIVAMFASNVGWLFLSVICIGLCNAVFWTLIIEAFGSEDKENKDRHSAIFSICHSFGKSLGFIFGGMLKSILGTTWTFSVMMIFLATLLIIMPIGMLPEKAQKRRLEKAAKKNRSTDPDAHEHGEVTVVKCEEQSQSQSQQSPESTSASTTPSLSAGTGAKEGDTVVAVPTPVVCTPTASPAGVSPSPASTPSSTPSLQHDDHPHQGSQRKGMSHSHRVFLYLGWMMNFSGYAVPVTIGNQFIKLITDRNIHFPLGEKPTEMFLGIFMGIIYLTQMCVSLTCSVWKGWRYNRWLIYCDEMLAAVACVLVAEVDNPYGLIVAAVLLGLFVGLSNLSSMAYSIEGGGSSVGVHELMLTVGGIVLPPLCGLLVNATDNLRAPYYLCFGLVLFTMLAQEVVAESYMWFILKHNDREGRIMVGALYGHEHTTKGFAPVLGTATPSTVSVSPSPRNSFELSHTPGIPLQDTAEIAPQDAVTIVEVEK